MAAALRRHLLKSLMTISARKGSPGRRIAFTGIAMTVPFLAAGNPSRSPLIIENQPWCSIQRLRAVRLDEIENEVFRFEKRSELINEQDAIHRSTIGTRLDKHEMFKLLTGKYEIATVDECDGWASSMRAT